MAAIPLDIFNAGLLAQLGNPHPSKNVLRWLAGWKTAESGKATKGVANFNPLNTAQEWPRSTFFNCLQRNPDGSCAFGVRNYANITDGIAATAFSLKNKGRYLAIVRALVTNDEAALGFPNGTPSAEVLSELRTWTGSSDVRGYVRNIFGGLDNGGLNMQWGGSGSGGGSGGGGSGLGDTPVVGPMLSPGSSLGEICAAIDSSMQVINPFVPYNPSVNINVDLNPVDWFGGHPPITTSFTSSPLDWLSTVGTNLVLDLRAILFRMALIIIGLVIVMRVVMRILPTEKVGEMAATAATEAAPLFI